MSGVRTSHSVSNFLACDELFMLVNFNIAFTAERQLLYTRGCIQSPTDLKTRTLIAKRISFLCESSTHPMTA